MKPGELSWSVEEFNWSLLSGRIQTITLSGDILRLDLWDDMSDDREPVCSENVPSDITLEDLHIKLRDIAKAESIKVLKRFLISYYQENFDDAVKKLSPFARELWSFSIDSVNRNLQKLKLFCEGAVGIDFVVQNVQADIQEGIGLLEKSSKK
ncbi:hypothetical protein QT972_24400 [Microcoleus sp. herbarium7]